MERIVVKDNNTITAHPVAGTRCMHCRYPVEPTQKAWYLPRPFYGLLHKHCFREFNYEPYDGDPFVMFKD